MSVITEKKETEQLEEFYFMKKPKSQLIQDELQKNIQNIQINKNLIIDYEIELKKEIDKLQLHIEEIIELNQRRQKDVKKKTLAIYVMLLFGITVMSMLSLIILSAPYSYVMASLFLTPLIHGLIKYGYARRKNS